VNDTARIEALEKRVAELETCLTKWAHVAGYVDPRLSKHLPRAPRTPPAPLPPPAPGKLWEFPAG
jgi:hypothetical protein